MDSLTALLWLFRSALVGFGVIVVLSCFREFRARPQHGALLAIILGATQLVLFPPMRVQANWQSSTSGSSVGPIMSTWLNYTQLDRTANQQAGALTVNFGGGGGTYEADGIGPRVDLLLCAAEFLILVAGVWFLHSLPAPRGHGEDQEGKDEIDDLLNDYDRDVRSRARRYRRMR